MIELKSIQKIYRTSHGIVEALRGIDLTVNSGEFVSIVGHSGSGKSTLMNILGCLDIPTAGRYTLSGQIITSLSPPQRAEIRNREIGFIFQSYNLAPRLTTLENVALPLMFRGIPRRQRGRMAEDALESVGLLDRKTHYPAQLSGGQQQRAAIARAIAAKPPIILADEPTGSLDQRAASECLDLLEGLNQAGHTILLITHDMAAATRAKRIVTMADGILIPSAS